MIAERALPWCDGAIELPHSEGYSSSSGMESHASLSSDVASRLLTSSASRVTGNEMLLWTGLSR
jgi:hypothetical protein